MEYVIPVEIGELYVQKNFSILKELLHEKNKEYLQIQKEKQQGSTGKFIYPKQIHSLVKKIIPQINEILDVQPEQTYKLKQIQIEKNKQATGTTIIERNKIKKLIQKKTKIEEISTFKTIEINIISDKSERNSSYHPLKELIRINSNYTTTAVGAIAHEYTHHVQFINVKLDIGENFIMEGHARGIEGIISKIFAQKYDNTLFTQKFIERTAKEFKEMYLVISEILNEPLQNELYKTSIPNYKIIKSIKHFERYKYVLGSSVMSIAEAKHGKKIYQDLIKNDFSFMKI